MEVSRKRRASTEVQELMNAVKNDYEFFERFDSPFQSAPATKPQRILNDNVFVQYAVVRPKPRYPSEDSQVFKPSNEKYLDGNVRFNEYNSIPKLIRVAPESRERSHKSSEQIKISREQEILPRDKHEKSRELLQNARDQNEKTCGQEKMFRKITPDFWASYGDERSIMTSPYTSKTTRIGCGPNSNHDSSPQVTNPGDFICLSSEPFISRGAEAIVPKKPTVLQKPKRLPPVIESPEKPPLLIRFDTSTTRQVSTNEVTIPRVSQSTMITYSGFPTNEPLVYGTAAKIRRVDVEEEPINVAKKMPCIDSEDEIIVVEVTSNPASSQSSDSLANKKAEECHVTSPQSSKKPDESKEVLPIERKSPDGESPLSLSLTDQIWPDYVITRVGSLLWLDKEVVYPITLDEMRRRIKDPENFSFQMLIAYVRHSRAKGRQFLDYWKCQPSGKTSRPNVLSKLCEADAKELVKGIENVHEEYFPHEALARNVAANIFQVNENRLTENEEGSKRAKEFAVQDKVNAIEKSRSVFKTMQATLCETQDDECFNAFNMASHNAGVENLKNSLKFLDGIFGRIQNYVQENNKNLPALTV